jgi:hypothetical protein
MAGQEIPNRKNSDFTGSTSHVSVKRNYGVKNKNFDTLQTG